MEERFLCIRFGYDFTRQCGNAQGRCDGVDVIGSYIIGWHHGVPEDQF